MKAYELAARQIERTNELEVRLARQVSRELKPSRRWQKLQPCPEKTLDGFPVYKNHLYTCSCRHHSEGWPLGGGPWAQIGIYCEDGQARHDFRDMQRIKNDLVGPEWEAIELFPAESRLMDPSNYYLLFAAPKIPIGVYDGRRIIGHEQCLAPQRPFSKDTVL